MDQEKEVHQMCGLLWSYQCGSPSVAGFWRWIFEFDNPLTVILRLPPEYQSLFRAIYRNTICRSRKGEEHSAWLPVYLTPFGIADWCEASW